MDDVDVIIVNYRSAAHTAACIAAVRGVARADGVRVAVTVVNNGDAPADLERAAAPSGPAVFVHNAANLGFGAACNIGAARGGAALILFLNPDAVLKPGYFKTCVAFMRDPANAGVGIVGPAIEGPDGRRAATSSPLPGAARLLAQTMGLARVFLPPDRHAHENSGHNSRVGQVMGAVLMIRRTVFASLGGFDERFFLYYEDVDLCARAARLGAACHYLSTARAMHVGRVSSSHDKGLTLALFLRSRLTYARLHFGRACEALLIAATFLIELPLRLLRAAPGTIGGAGGGSASITGAAALRAYRLLFANLVSGAEIVTLGARGRK